MKNIIIWLENLCYGNDSKGILSEIKILISINSLYSTIFKKELVNITNSDEDDSKGTIKWILIEEYYQEISKKYNIGVNIIYCILEENIFALNIPFVNSRTLLK